MGLFKKLIRIDDVKKELHPSSFGALELYPDGTTRTIKLLTIQGWIICEQIASIQSDTDGDAYYHYNAWKNVL